MATLTANAAAVKSAATAIDAAIVAKGGTTEGGLRNAAAAIAALPSGGDGPIVDYDGNDTIVVVNLTNATDREIVIEHPNNNGTIDWGDGTSTITSTANASSRYNRNQSYWYSHTYATSGKYEIRSALFGAVYAAYDYLVRKGADYVEEVYFGSSTNVFYLRNCGYIKRIGIGSRSSVQSMALWGVVFDSGFVRHISTGSIKYNLRTASYAYCEAVCSLGYSVIGDTTNVTFPAGGEWSSNPNEVLRTIDVPIGDYSFGTMCFNNAFGLRRLNGVRKAVMPENMHNMFSNCYGLRELPNEIDASVTTNSTNAFNNLYSLKRLPNITINKSFTFAQSTNIEDGDSIATFDADGNLDGGMLGKINTCANDSQTITLNSWMKSFFTADERTIIETAVAAKNWTLAW